MGEADQRSALADGWHVSIGGATHGPYDWLSVVGWARDGRIGYVPPKEFEELYYREQTPVDDEGLEQMSLH
jgi:hypothetical protein